MDSTSFDYMFENRIIAELTDLCQGTRSDEEIKRVARSVFWTGQKSRDIKIKRVANLLSSQIKTKTTLLDPIQIGIDHALTIALNQIRETTGIEPGEEDRM
jgi:Na+-transporting NADH:ubiquinone oxidoreductase subunit NqrC